LTTAAVFGRGCPRWRIPRPAWLAYVAFFPLYAVVLRYLSCPPFSWFYVPSLT